MAPTVPSKRPSIRAKSSSKVLSRPAPSHRPNTIASDSFVNSKKDKRTIKHSAFVNRIEKSHKKPLKRRRPNKKLVTTLESLGDALGELEDGIDGNGLEERVKEGKIRLKGLKSRPGAMKRREKLERSERERFGKNMAQLTTSIAKEGAAAMQVESQKGVMETQTSATASRWAALRGFISQTMEQKEEFTTKT